MGLQNKLLWQYYCITNKSNPIKKNQIQNIVREDVKEMNKGSPRICSTCRKYFPVLSSYMTSRRVCNQSNQTAAPSGAGTAFSSGVPEFTRGFQWGSCYSIFSFLCIVLQIVVSPSVIFLLTIVLSDLLRLMDSDYPFGILKLYLVPKRFDVGRFHCSVFSLDVSTKKQKMIIVWNPHVYLLCSSNNIHILYIAMHQNILLHILLINNICLDTFIVFLKIL